VAPLGPNGRRRKGRGGPSSDVRAWSTAGPRYRLTETSLLRARRRAHHGKQSTAGAVAPFPSSNVREMSRVVPKHSAWSPAWMRRIVCPRPSGCITTQAEPDQTQFPVPAGARPPCISPRHRNRPTCVPSSVHCRLWRPMAVLRTRQIWVPNPFDENTHRGENGRGMEVRPPPMLSRSRSRFRQQLTWSNRDELIL
jgi:hypothetical protein